MVGSVAVSRQAGRDRDARVRCSRGRNGDSFAAAVGGSQWDEHRDGGSLTGRGLSFALASDRFEAVLEVGQTHASAANARGVEADAFIGNGDFEAVVDDRHLELDFQGAGVTRDVVERFFNGQEEVMACVAVQRGLRKLDRYFQAAADAAGGEEFTDEAADVIGQWLEGVSGGVNGPNDDVQGVDNAAGFVGDELKTLVRSIKSGRRARSDVGEEANLRDARAEFVVEIAGKAGAFCFNQAFGLDAFALLDFGLELPRARFDFAT